MFRFKALVVTFIIQDTEAAETKEEAAVSSVGACGQGGRDGRRDLPGDVPSVGGQ